MTSESEISGGMSVAVSVRASALRCVACTAMSLTDRGETFKTGTLSFDNGCMVL